MVGEALVEAAGEALVDVMREAYDVAALSH
jgi:hypothetical protein